MFSSKAHGTPLELRELLEFMDIPSLESSISSRAWLLSLFSKQHAGKSREAHMHVATQWQRKPGVQRLCYLLPDQRRPQFHFYYTGVIIGNRRGKQQQEFPGPHLNTHLSRWHTSHVSCPDVCGLWVTSVPSPFLIQHMGSQQVSQTNVQHEKKVQEHYKPNEVIV